MFRNLYYLQVRSFADHNFTDFMDKIEKLPESWIETQLGRSYRGEAIDFFFESMLPLTLSLESYESLVRSEPRLPIAKRDFFLSKLFQFVYLPLRAKYESRGQFDEFEIRQYLEQFLETIPDHLLPHLHRFDWVGFYTHTLEYPLDEVLANLPAYLPDLEGEIPIKAESPKQLIDRLRGRHQLTIEALADKAGVDIKQVYKVRRGEDVTTKTIKKIASALGCEPGDLVSR